MYSRSRRFKLASQLERTYSGEPLICRSGKFSPAMPNLVATWTLSLGNCFKAWSIKSDNETLQSTFKAMAQRNGYLSEQKFVSIVGAINISSVKESDSFGESMLNNS